MSDPAIKLFGKTIAVPLPAEDGGGDDIIHKVFTETKEDEDREIEPGNGEPLASSTAHEHDDKESTIPDEDASAEEQQSDSSEKTLRKPDKILPCPRCKSMDTKFCYYNNYNINQPRHFCKNCQRYWTAGGTMRNVPVGAGRRKNKNSIHHPALKTNGTVLSFSSNQMVEKSTGPSIDEGVASNLQGFAPHFVWPYLWTPPFSPPAAYWGCSSWSMPCISLGSGPGSPTLGKHSRDNNSSKQSNLWIPKTSRVGDPEAAARCSMWATMGSKNDKVDCGGMFREFDSHMVEANSQVLHANPAAWSRSINFQETS